MADEKVVSKKLPGKKKPPTLTLKIVAAKKAVPAKTEGPAAVKKLPGKRKPPGNTLKKGSTAQAGAASAKTISVVKAGVKKKK